MKATIEIDMDEIKEEGFEGAVTDALVRKLTATFGEKAESFVNDKIDKMIVDSVDAAIDKKLTGLLEEPVVISNRWGKKEFLGNVEDYIKKEIDDKLLKPVDSEGKKLNGCSSDNQTWLEWAVNKAIKEAMEKVLDSTKRESMSVFLNIAQAEMAKITDDATKAAISKVIGKVMAG